MTDPLSAPTSPSPLLRAVGWLGATGASLGLAVGTLVLVPDLQALLARNELPPTARTALLGIITLGALLGVGLAIFLTRRSVARAEQWALRAAPMAVMGAVPLLFSFEGFRDREVTLLVALLLSVVGLERLCARAQRAEPLFSWARARKLQDRVAQVRWLPPALLGAGVVAFALYFSILTVGNHHALRTSALDLGLEENVLWNAAHLSWPPLRTTPLGPPYCHLGYHQTWLSYLIAPFYRLLPRAEFLLVLQACMTALAAVPLFLLARRRLGPWWAIFVASLFLVYAPLQGSILFDFHYQPLANVLVLSAVYCLMEGKTRWAVLWVLLALATREDMAWSVGVFAAALVLTGERPRAGALVGAICGVYFVAQRFFIMPALLDGASAHLHAYSGMLPAHEHGFAGVLKTVFSNPGFTLEGLLEPRKLRYVLELLAPLALLPLRRPIGWLLVLPGFFFTLLSTQYPPLVVTSFQYTSFWTIFLFVGAVWSLERLAPRARLAWGPALLLGGLVSTFHFGAVAHPDQIRGGWDRHHFGLTAEEKERYGQVIRLTRQIPPGDSVVATDRLVPHVSNRADAFAIRHGLLDATWLFLGPLHYEEEKVAVAAALRSEYGIVAREGDFMIARRGASKDLNEAWLKDLGCPPPEP